MSAPAALGPGEWEMQVVWVDPDRLVPNPQNPNTEDDATFNALVRSIETEGWTQPVLAVAEDPTEPGIADLRYRIVGGEHRWRAAKVLNCRVPVLPLRAEEFDADRQDWNVVKDNLLRGRLNPEKFARLYERMTQKYDAQVLQELMGFTSADAFQKVYKEARAALPPELQKALDDARDEIKTIDGLALVLNRLFREFGEDLPSNFMTFSWAGKQVLWIQADDDLWNVVSGVAKLVSENGSDMAVVMRELLGGSVAVAEDRVRSLAGASV